MPVLTAQGPEGVATQRQPASSTPLERIVPLHSLIAQNAARAEKEGRIVAPVLAALRDTGLFSLLAPKRSGGEGAPIRDHVDVVAGIAKSCAGSAWAFGILTAATGTARALPATQTQTLFRRGDELVCFIGARTGVAVPTEGGFLVSGAWRYASGCLHADWAMCGVTIRDRDGAEEGTGHVFVDLADSASVSIVNDWQVAGLLASGSNQVRVEQHFVPSALLLANGAGTVPAQPLPDREPRDSWPYEPLAPLTMIPAMLGAAEGLLEAVGSAMTGRPVLKWGYASQADSHALLGMLGEAAMKIRSARMHIHAMCDLLDTIAPVRPVTQMEKVEAQASGGYAMRLLREGAGLLMDIAGPAGFTQDSAMQRLWRDINLGTRHNSANAGFSLELLGRALTGQPSNLDIITSF